MCLISAHMPGAKPVRKHLENGLETAPHGAGYAIITPGADKVPTSIYCKSLNGQMMLDQFMDLCDYLPHSWAVFWSRRSTGSLVSLDNCQPFLVGTDPETVLFHNGHLFDTGDPRESDTRCFARDLGIALDSSLSQSLDAPHMFRALDTQISATDSKVIILTTNPRYERLAYIFNREQWYEEDGVLHSQPDYLGFEKGWSKQVMDAAPADPEEGQAGDEWWFNLPQPGDCERCNKRGHDSLHCTEPRAKTPKRWRNESQNNRRLAELEQRYGRAG